MKTLDQELQIIGDKIAKLAKQAAPVDTGALKNSIKADHHFISSFEVVYDKSDGGTDTVTVHDKFAIVINEKYYGTYQDTGTWADRIRPLPGFNQGTAPYDSSRRGVPATNYMFNAMQTVLKETGGDLDDIIEVLTGEILTPITTVKKGRI